MANPVCEGGTLATVLGGAIDTKDTESSKFHGDRPEGTTIGCVTHEGLSDPGEV